MAKQPWEIFGAFAVAEIGDAFAVVDASDVSIVEQHRWYLLKSKTNFYAATGQGVLMHRLLLGLVRGDGTHADHIDTCGLNNWRDNLRVSTPGQNRAHSRKHKSGASRFKGVRPVGKKWAAELRKTGQGGGMERFYLGLFATEEAAALAYDEKAREIFGEFSYPNIQRQAA
jgi:hypothetical protein